MSRLKFHVKKGDDVEVVSGNHRGAAGKILQVLPKKQQVLVEGVRIIKKTVRKSQDHPNGAVINREGPIHISNVKIVEKKTAKRAKKAKAE
jgi:large subunit ribosomal protein L24